MRASRNHSNDPPPGARRAGWLLSAIALLLFAAGPSRAEGPGPARSSAMQAAGAAGSAGAASASNASQQTQTATGDCPPDAPITSSAPAPAPTLAPGIAPGSETPPAGAGEIVSLPRALDPRTVDAVPGEAIIAMPRSVGGALPQGLRLASSARVAESFWSPVLCSTMMRVVGPQHLSPRDLIASAPPGTHISPNIRYVTAGAEVRPLPSVASGPDPYLSMQHGLRRTGVLEGRPTFAGAGVRVAVLDSTPDITHRELDRVRVLPLPSGPPPVPALHGTLVAGVIAALENNAYGGAGIAPEADVMAIPVCAPSAGAAADVCRMNDLLQGIDLAWKNDARVVSLALVGPPDALLQRAIERLEGLGVVVVAAAGNEGSDEPRYPAAYPTVIGVGAVDEQGRSWPRSNRGAWVALSGPGTEILSTIPGDLFAFGDGTSLAAAHVAGLAAVLMMAADRPLDVRASLLAVARKAGGSAAAVASNAPGATPAMPRLCDVLPSLGHACSDRLPTPARTN